MYGGVVSGCNVCVIDCYIGGYCRRVIVWLYVLLCFGVGWVC